MRGEIFIVALWAMAALAQNRKACHESLTVDITMGTRGVNNTIVHNNITYKKEHYYVTPDAKSVRGCICNAVGYCFRKCCPLGQIYKGNNCAPSNHSLAFDFKVPVHQEDEEVSVSRNHFTIINSNFCENGAYLLDPLDSASDAHYLQVNGTLFMPLGEPDQQYKRPEDFCLEVFDFRNATLALVCFPDVVDSSTMYSIGMLISMPFLLVTFFVYACVPELQNIHGKCLMCYVMTLFTAYVFLVTVQLDGNISPTLCQVAPFIIYFSFMVSFLWLNVMCIDIWWTFSGRRGFRGSIRQSENKRFLVYSAYAWGVPAVMLVVAITLQFVGNLPDNIVRPSFGEMKCWFASETAVGYYFYFPILLIIVLNLGLFGYTTIKIWQVHRDTDQSMRHESQRHGDETDKQRYWLYLKLMLVFGVNWLMEIVSWLVTGPQWLWYVTDMCNALYGVFIFFIFVCKANVWKLVRKRYHVMMGRPFLGQTLAPTSSTRSTGMNHSVANGVSDSFALTTSTAA